jgi:oxidase EvaA
VNQPTWLSERVSPGQRTAQRFTESAAQDGRFMSTDDCLRWLAEHRETMRCSVERVPFDRLDGWHFADDTGNLVHRTGRFFSIEGLRVGMRPGRVAEWSQPIIVQPEIGILGILVKEFDGVLHCLMQAKMEPGNANLVQLSPTVQATRSNYTRVHQGTATPYLEHFLSPRDGEVLADSLQSEQGGWFLRKRNRNIVVETRAEVQLLPEFCWLTLAQIHQLLRIDNAVNMDARTVLSIMPFAAPESADDGSFSSALARSLDPASPTVHSLTDTISWLTESKTRYELSQRPIALRETAGWRRTETSIEHEGGDHFSIVGVDVHAQGREVSAWMQPLLMPAAPGLLAFLTRRFDGVLHVLLQARPAAGAMDVVEAAPTVHCTPYNHRKAPAEQRPRFLSYALTAHPSQILFDTLLSEEGGRFLRAVSRYQIIEVDDAFPAEAPDGFIWLSVSQIATLLRFGNCLNVETRTLLAGLRTLL